MTRHLLQDCLNRLGTHAALDDLESFQAGRSTLNHVEREALGNVAGKSMLHLQCQCGLDTLSWVREGAVVTGVDSSEEAIKCAWSLSDELHLPATFLCANLFDLPRLLHDTFDIVFSGYGVLPRLRDLERWAAVIRHFLKPGGTFLLVDFHPVLYTLDARVRPFARPYFDEPEVTSVEDAGRSPGHQGLTHTWTHPLGDVVTALASAGLHVEALREHPYVFHRCFPFLEEHAPGRYGLPGRPNAAPLLFSVKAVQRPREDKAS